MAVWNRFYTHSSHWLRLTETQNQSDLRVRVRIRQNFDKSVTVKLMFWLAITLELLCSGKYRLTNRMSPPPPQVKLISISNVNEWPESSRTMGSAWSDLSDTVTEAQSLPSKQRAIIGVTLIHIRVTWIKHTSWCSDRYSLVNNETYLNMPRSIRNTIKRTSCKSSIHLITSIIPSACS